MERLVKIGSVAPVHSSQVGESFVGVGFEKLDRGAFDPEMAYDKIAETGAKWARIQSGWARTEKSKGVYDFAWLDAIVDNLIRRGLRPWLCLCYGNALYTPAAATVFGAVGCPPIHSDEEKRAWHDYVVAAVKHYRGRIGWYEVWNEPDGVWCWKHGPSGAEYGEFTIATAKAVKEGDPEAKVIGGSTCQPNGTEWVAEMFETGAGKFIDALSYHGYRPDELAVVDRARALRAMCRAANPAIELIQGETGAQSRSDGAGAMSGAAWTPRRQAKFIARHYAVDLMLKVKFGSCFSCMDMMEALNGTVGDTATYKDFGYFGLLGAEFDENNVARGTVSPKPAFRTMQTIAAIFREEFTIEDLPVQIVRRLPREGIVSPRLLRADDTEIQYQGFRRPNGSAAFLWWMPTELLTTEYESTVSFDCCLLPDAEPRLVDLVDGSIYAIPAEMIRRGTGSFRRFMHLPVRDYPLMLTFGGFILPPAKR